MGEMAITHEITAAPPAMIIDMLWKVKLPANGKIARLSKYLTMRHEAFYSELTWTTFIDFWADGCGVIVIHTVRFEEF
jgi:hypothetical protein